MLALVLPRLDKNSNSSSFSHNIRFLSFKLHKRIDLSICGPRPWSWPRPRPSQDWGGAQRPRTRRFQSKFGVEEYVQASVEEDGWMNQCLSIWGEKATGGNSRSRSHLLWNTSAAYTSPQLTARYISSPVTAVERSFFWSMPAHCSKSSSQEIGLEEGSVKHLRQKNRKTPTRNESIDWQGWRNVVKAKDLDREQCQSPTFPISPVENLSLFVWKYTYIVHIAFANFQPKLCRLHCEHHQQQSWGARESQSEMMTWLPLPTFFLFHTCQYQLQSRNCNWMWMDWELCQTKIWILAKRNEGSQVWHK